MKPKPWNPSSGELWPPRIAGDDWRISFIEGIFGGGDHNENEWHKIELSRFSYPIYLRVARPADDDPVCTGLHIDSGASDITARQLRAIPIAHIVATIATHGQAYGLELESTESVTRSKPGPKGHPVEFFERVAAVHRRALAANQHPVRQIASELYASASTVKRWIDRCRMLGLDLYGDGADDSTGSTVGANGLHRSNS